MLFAFLVVVGAACGCPLSLALSTDPYNVVGRWQHDPSLCIDPRTMGAMPGNASYFMNNSQAIQRAFDSTASKESSGCVVLTGGDFWVEEVDIRSNTLLIIDKGARFLAAIGNYLHSKAVVHVYNASNVTITGEGSIHGNAELDISYYNQKDNQLVPKTPDGQNRPNTLLISNSVDIVVTTIRITNSSDWTFRMDSSRNIFVDSVYIYGDSRFPNNDGFDPESCVNVTLVNSYISVGDDGICPKSSIAGPLQGLTVRNTTIRSNSHAIKFGSNTDSKISDILFDNITIWGSNGGMAIQQRGAGDVVNVTWSNIVLETQYVAPRWWGNGDWIGITSNPRAINDTIGSIINISFINVTARSENGGLVSGLAHGVHGMLLENVHLTIGTWSNYSTGQGPPCFTGIGKQIECMGSRDYRPALPGHCSYYCREEGQANGLYLEHVYNAVLRNVTVEFESPRKSWFGNCIHIDSVTKTAGVVGIDEVKCINGE